MSDLRPRGTGGRLRIAAAVVGAIVVFVLLPGYLATRPTFFDRYPSLRANTTAWASSTHRAASCQDCHARPRIDAQGLYSGRMLAEFYVSVVYRKRSPKVFSAPSNDACVSCHDELRTVSPKGDLRIPHRAHVEILKMQCVDCHGYLVHATSPEGKHTPPMSACLKCHDGDTAKDNCSACHTEKALPVSHKSNDWLIAHPGKLREEDCKGCHAWIDEWCVDCHTRRPRSHTKDWREVHRDKVAQHRNCEACHAPAFCIRCHGIVPQQNFDPALKMVE